MAVFGKKTFDGKSYNFCVTCGVPLTEENFRQGFSTPTCIEHEAAYQADARNVQSVGIHEQPYVTDVSLSSYDCETGQPIHYPASRYGAEYQVPPYRYPN